MFKLLAEFVVAIWEDLLDPCDYRRERRPTGQQDVAGPQGATAREPLPEPDGRYFVWYWRLDTREGIAAAIVHGELIGGKMELVGKKHVLSPAEYGDPIATLVKRYPPPTVILSKEQ